MTDEIPALRLEQSWRECRQHARYMRYALTALGPVLPLIGNLDGRCSSLVAHGQVVDHRHGHARQQEGGDLAGHEG